MKIISFNIATKDGTAQACGNPVWFTIGERKVKFVLQYSYPPDVDVKGKATWLTHFASGHKFGRLDDAAVELMCKLTPNHRFTKKQLAQFLIDKMVARFGTEELLKKLDAVPVINSTKKDK